VESLSKVFVVFVSIGSVDYVLDDTIDYFAPAGALRGSERIGFRRFPPPAIVCRPFGTKRESAGGGCWNKQIPVMRPSVK